MPRPSYARLLVVLIGTALLSLGAHADAGGPAPKSSLTHRSYTEPGGLTRSYFLYQPAGLKPGRPVVMFLHGCNQTATEAISANRFDALADREHFTVIYPEQTRPATGSAPIVDGNGLGCWNWFLPQDQARGSGEPAVLAGMAQAVTRAVKGDRKRVYVEGVSAGADMTVILAATYPDVFAAVGSVAGCSFSTCADLTGELTNRAMGSHARVVPMFIENGTADVLNPWPQSEGLALSWLGADDLADDGAMNGSISRVPATKYTWLPSGTPSPGSGDACIHNNSFLCLGGILGLSDYPRTVRTWNDAGGKDILELWVVHGMAHAQPHATNDGSYTDPLGPDLTKLTYAFFLQHHLP